MSDSHGATIVQAVERIAVVGVDFGTHGSGFAYKFRASSSAPRMMEVWPDQPAGSCAPKTRTSLLYNRRDAVAWGHTARKQWADGDSRADAGSHQAYLAENFKLAIASSDRRAGREQLPEGITAVQAAADYLTFMRK